MKLPTSIRSTSYLTPLLLLPFTSVLGDDVLQSNGYSSCMDNSQITIQKLDIAYTPADNVVNFDVAGHSDSSQKVTASLNVKVYGNSVYTKDFNPCDDKSKVDMLCPIPAGDFAAKGSLPIPAQYASQIPSMAFNVPDLDAEAILTLKSLDSGAPIACLDSTVGNGKSIDTKAISYLAAGIAGAAVIISGVSAAGSALTGAAGGSGVQPSFGTLVGHFQGIATSGMLSVSYPPVYRSFTKNFAFSTGLVPWTQMQNSIDSFRNTTGGNLTEANYEYLLQNATMSQTDSSSRMVKRDLDARLGKVTLWTRDVASNSSSTTTDSGSSNSKMSGIANYVESLAIPRSNTFMTVLLVFAIAIAAVIVFILLFKVILETWALCGNFPKKLTGFRKRYWGLIGRTVTNMILVLYGIWTLYCVYQFTNGDSWAAKLLAGVTLVIFTGLLGWFTWKIWSLARRAKGIGGSSEQLFNDKDTWIKYSLFYDQYKKDAWWVFIPYIIYMFTKGCVIAGGDGHGLGQAGGQLIVEAIFFIFLVWKKPFYRRTSNWINISIQVVRALSVVCILIFVDEFGIAVTTKTIAGLILIVVQCVLTAILAILLCIDGFIMCCRPNRHRQERKELEKGGRRDKDDLTGFESQRSSIAKDKKETLAMADLPSAKSTEAGYPTYAENKGLAYNAAPMGMTYGKGHNRNQSVESQWTDAGSMYQRAAPQSRGNQWRERGDGYPG